MSHKDIRYAVNGGVARITINRPDVDNMMTTRTYEELLVALRDAEAEPRAGVVVLRGAGAKAFSVGGDFRAHSGRTAIGFRQHLGLLMNVAMAIRNNGKPVIAAVNGNCFGGAHQLVLLCDLAIAAEHARFGQHGLRRGAAPIFWGTQLLPRIVGEKRAREMIFLCREYTAHDALAMGLVNKVVPLEHLDGEVDRWCRELLTMSPQGLRIAKTSVNYGSDLHYAAIWHARELLSMVAGTPEFKTAVDAHLAGKTPDFRPFREIRTSKQPRRVGRMRKR